MQSIHGKKERRNEETLPVFHRLSYYQPLICSVTASPFKSAWCVLHVSVIQFLNIFSEFSFKALVSTLGEKWNVAECEALLAFSNKGSKWRLQLLRVLVDRIFDLDENKQCRQHGQGLWRYLGMNIDLALMLACSHSITSFTIQAKYTNLSFRESPFIFHFSHAFVVLL